MQDMRINGKRYPAPTGPEPAGGMVVEAAETHYVVSMTDFLQVIRKRLWVIMLVAATLVGATVAFSLAQTPEYEASIKILVGQERGIIEAPDQVMGLQQLTQTMAQGVSSRPVAEAVIRRQDLQTTPDAFLAKDLSVEQIPNTQFIEVSYKDPNPERARRVANTVGGVFSERVSEVSSSTNSISATVWEPAATPDEPASPKPARNGLLALALGLMFGLGLALLLEYFDESWRSPEEVEQITGVPTYGVIPESALGKGKKGYQDG